MSPRIRTTLYWIAGALIALGGGALVRFTPQEGTVALRVIGHLLAGFGLLVIAVGVRNRLTGN